MNWKNPLGFVVAATLLLTGFPFSWAASRGETDTALSLAWRLVGPFRAGWATMVTGVPNQPAVFYFGAAGGGVWKTPDAGRTWTSLFDRGPPAVGAIAVSPSDPKTIYVGTGQPEPRYDIAAGMGVFKSRDGGTTWTSLGLQDT